MTISLTGAERSLTEQIPPARRRVAIVVAVATIVVGSAYGVARLRSTSCTWSNHRFAHASSDLVATGDGLADDAPLDAVEGIARTTGTSWIAGATDPPVARGWCGTARGQLVLADATGAHYLRWHVSVYTSSRALTHDLALERALDLREASSPGGPVGDLRPVAVTAPGMPVDPPRCRVKLADGCHTWARTTPLPTPGCHLLLTAQVDSGGPAHPEPPRAHDESGRPPVAPDEPVATATAVELHGALADVLTDRLASLCPSW